MTSTEDKNHLRKARRGLRFSSLIRPGGSIALMLLIAATCLAGPEGDGRNEITRFRMGTPKDFFGIGNANDTKAAITVWAKSILGVTAVTEDSKLTTVFDSTDEMIKAYENREIDGMTMLTMDFIKVKSRPADVYLMNKNRSIAIRYVILVHRGSAIDDLRQLKGRNLLLYNGQTMGMAGPWIETLLAGHSMGPMQEAFGSVKRMDTGASRAILQVFFRQVDACVVAQDMFTTACELNPQVEKDVKPLVASPEVVPTSFILHPQYDPSNRKAVDAAIAELDKSPAGRQVLTVFQADKLMKQPVSALDGTLALAAEYARIRRSDAAGAKAQQLSQASSPGKN